VSWYRRFNARGVFWRQLLRFAVLNTPLWLEPIVMATWSLVFLLWGPGRRGIMHNLTAIKPRSWMIANVFRAFRVFWNYAWTIADTVRFKESRTIPDWEFVGMEHFDSLKHQGGGAIILTAHMGNYDLAAHLFAETSGRAIVMVRAPESDPETRRYEEAALDKAHEALKVDFSGETSDLAFDLLGALQRGEIVAIQGDRVTPGISALPATLFGKPTSVPAGPFALAMAARVPIYPLFIFRLGRRRYRLVTSEPIEVVRTRDRNDAFQRASEQWMRRLESVISTAWFQWFSFEPFSEEPRT
jgi:phosphatidylinositol dimannoside acyltransferase